MQINITINPTYQHLSDFIESLPSIFETEGELVYDDDAASTNRLYRISPQQS